jgi:cell volume regulation protein A
MELLVLGGAGLIFCSILLTPLSARIGAPLLLLFLLLGMLVGEDGPGRIAFDNFDLAFHIGSIALAIILFAGGLSTPLATVKKGAVPAAALATLGVLLTTALVGAAAIWMLGFPVFEGLLLGAVVSSTDAAATFLVLQQRAIELKGRNKETILVESGINDPTAIFLTTVLVTLVDTDASGLSWSVAHIFVLQLGLGAAAGLIGGYLLARLVGRLHLDAGLNPVFVLSGGLMVFTSTQLAGGSGFLAVYLCGMLFRHLRGRHAERTINFHDGLAWLAQIVLFLMLGLLVTPSTLPAEVWQATVVAVTLMFIARPLATMVCLAPLGFTLQEQAFVGWVGLRGAVPIFLAIIPVISPGPVTVEFFNTVFIVVIASLVLQGWTVPWLAKRLDLEASPEDLMPRATHHAPIHPHGPSDRHRRAAADDARLGAGSHGSDKSPASTRNA